MKVSLGERSFFRNSRLAFEGLFQTVGVLPLSGGELISTWCSAGELLNFSLAYLLANRDDIIVHNLSASVPQSVLAIRRFFR